MNTLCANLWITLLPNVDPISGTLGRNKNGVLEVNLPSACFRCILLHNLIELMLEAIKIATLKSFEFMFVGEKEALRSLSKMYKGRKCVLAGTLSALHSPVFAQPDLSAIQPVVVLPRSARTLI